MKLKERNVLNKTFLFFYIVLMVVAPLIILLIGLNKNITEFSDSSLMNWGRVLFFFVSAPVYGVYAVLMVKEYFPEKNKNAMMLFVPILFTIGIYYFTGSKQLFEMLMSDSLPLYLGLNSLFFVGLIVLIVKNIKGEKEKFKRLIVMLIIFFIVFFPVFCLFVIGYELSIKYATADMDKLQELLKFGFSIGLVIVFHYKLLIRMYREGGL